MVDASFYGLNAAQLQEYYDRQDSRRCQKGKHETTRPVFAGPHGGVLEWRCFCGALREPPRR